MHFPRTFVAILFFAVIRCTDTLDTLPHYTLCNTIIGRVFSDIFYLAEKLSASI